MTNQSLSDVIEAARTASMELLRTLHADQPAPVSLMDRRASALATLALRLPAEGGAASMASLQELVALDAEIGSVANLLRARLADETARLRAMGTIRCFGDSRRQTPTSFDLTA